MELLTQQEAASMLNVSVRTVERLRHKGQIKTVRLSYRTIRIPKLDVERLIEGSRWNGNQHVYGKEMANGMSHTQNTEEAKNFHLGRMILKKQKLVSLHGKKTTTFKL